METTPKAHVGKRKIVAAIATPMDTWLAQNIARKPADNQDPTTTEMQHDKSPWGATWKESQTPTPDKKGRHVGA